MKTIVVIIITKYTSISSFVNILVRLYTYINQYENKGILYNNKKNTI